MLLQKMYSLKSDFFIYESLRILIRFLFIKISKSGLQRNDAKLLLIVFISLSSIFCIERVFQKFQ